MKRWNWWVALCVCYLLTGCYNANESREKRAQGVQLGRLHR